MPTMGARSVDTTGVETGVVKGTLMDADADSTRWISVVSGVACAKTTGCCDETCAKVGSTFSSMEVSYIIV